MVVGDDVAGRVDDEARTEGDALHPFLVVGMAAELVRDRLAVAAMLLEKAAQKLLERRIIVAGRRVERLIRHLVVGGRLFGNRDIDDRRQHFLDQRRKALLGNLRRRDRGVPRARRGVGLGPDERRQRQRRGEPRRQRGAAPAFPPGAAVYIGLCHSDSPARETPRSRPRFVASTWERLSDTPVSRGLNRCNPNWFAL